MKQNEIIEMARQAGIESNEYDTYSELSLKAFVCVDYELETFAKLVAAKEREACLSCYSVGDDVTDWVDKILARGEA